MSKKPNRPKDPNQLAKFIMEIASDQRELPENRNNGKNSAAVALGRLGGLKGGNARAVALSPERRKEIAQKAIAARWKNKD